MIPTIVYRSGDRGLHRASPVGSLILLTSLLVAVLASPGITVKLISLGLVFALTAWSGEPPAAWCKSLRFVAFFAAVLLVAHALSVREGTRLFSFGVPVTVEGLLAGGETALRFFVILAASFLFVITTDPDRLAHTMISLGIPYRYGYVFILALRFVPFFRDELRTVREAQRMRGIQTSVRSLSGIRRAVRYTFVPVLVSGLMRVDTVAMSMKGRAFGLYPKRTVTIPVGWNRVDGIAMGMVAVLIGLTVVSRRLGWL